MAFDTFPGTYKHGATWKWTYWTAKDGTRTGDEAAAAKES